METSVQPTFNDIARNADAGFVRKALGRYFFTRNYERSIHGHEAIGSPILRKVVMGTVGKATRPLRGENWMTYRLDGTKRNRMDAIANYATIGSVVNEVVHTTAAINILTDVASDFMQNGPEFQGGRFGAIAVNLGLVAVQRYNRARTIRAMDRSLQHGSEFSPAYKNWLGIDSRAVENFRDEQQSFTDNQQFPVAPLASEPDMQPVG